MSTNGHRSACTPEVATILENIAESGKALSHDGAGAEIRRELLASARSLILALETPVESITRIAWAEVRVSLLVPMDYRGLHLTLKMFCIANAKRCVSNSD